jgi:hypothetical protein
VSRHFLFTPDSTLSLANSKLNSGFLAGGWMDTGCATPGMETPGFDRATSLSI